MAKPCSYLAAALFSVLLFSTIAYSQAVPFDSALWEIKAEESKVVEHLGRQSLYLKGGIAALKESHFTDGVIEFDIAFTGERGFMGAVWRMQNLENYEEFYLRPHQSGNPDANQYQPVFNGMASWQLYYGEGFGAPVKYDFNQWMHIKIVVSGKNAEVYIKDMDKPALFVNELKRETSPGNVGLSAGNFAPAYFSNFSFKAANNPSLKGKAKGAEAAPPGAIMSWMVSDIFEGKSLERKYELTGEDRGKLSWRKLDCEQTALANLARVQGIKGDKNTVFARVAIQSETEQTKKLRFGFSDEVKVYLNGRLIYGGSDVYRSRDYRFLGTVGLYDELYLSLKKGRNELWVAVTENFGGWGLKAVFEETRGIRVEE